MTSPNDPPLTVRATKEGDVVTLALFGSFTLDDSVDERISSVTKHVPKGTRHIVVDINGLTRFDSVTLGALVAITARLNRDGISVEIRSSDPGLGELLRIMKLL